MTGRWFALLHADPWSRELIDLPSLNSTASAAIERAVQETRAAARDAPRSLRGRSIVVLGPAGAGKTHLFARLRRSLGRRAAFVLVRPLLGATISPRYLLMQIVDQLARDSYGSARVPQAGRRGQRAFSQLDGVLGSLAADFLCSPSPTVDPSDGELAPRSTQERDARVERLLEQALERWPQLDDSYLRVLLQTPFAPPPERRALLAWLSGREPDEVELARIGRREGLSEELVLPALKTLGAAAAAGSPIVLVFDQLENLIDAHDQGRVRAYGSLIAELVDEVRGVVVVQMALDSEWHRGIEPAFGTTQRTRVSLETVPLALPTSAEREALLRLWARALCPSTEAFPAPFGGRRVEAWCAEVGMTPRMLLLACGRALEQQAAGRMGEAPADAAEPAESDADRAERRAEAVAEAWQEELDRARSLLDEAGAAGRCVEAEVIGDSLGVAIGLVPGLRLASVDYGRAAQLEVHAARSEPTTTVAGHGTLHIALLAKGHPRSVLATLDALLRREAHDRVVVIRERSHEFPPTWKACLDRRSRLLERPTVRWLDLDRADAEKLLAVRSLLADARSSDVTDEAGRPLDEAVVRSWIETGLDPRSWPPMQLLLGHASPTGELRPPRPTEPPPTSRRTPARPRATLGGSPSVVTALGVLRQLRVASLDRLVREVTRLDERHTRATVLAELEEQSACIQWFGRSVVAIAIKEIP